MANSLQITYNGATIRYDDRGTGKAVVLLHGFLESRRMWDDYAAELARNYRVVTIDLPGHGESDCLGYVHAMEDMAGVVRAVTDHLRLRRYALVGHSMGGYVALAFAEAWPDIPRGIVLFHSAPFADSPKKKTERDRAIALVKRSPGSFVRQGISQLFRPRSRKIFRKEIAELKALAVQTPLQGIIANLEGMKIRRDREKLLHTATFPFMIIAGKRDAVIPIDKIQPLFNAPKVVDRLVTENGHMGYIEDRDLCLEAIRYFLRETTARDTFRNNR